MRLGLICSGMISFITLICLLLIREKGNMLYASFSINLRTKGICFISQSPIKVLSQWSIRPVLFSFLFLTIAESTNKSWSIVCRKYIFYKVKR